MTEGYDRDNPSGDRPFSICPRGGDYRLQIAKSIIISTLFGAECIKRTGQATNVFVNGEQPPPSPCPLQASVLWAPFSPRPNPNCTSTPSLAPTLHLRVHKLFLLV